MKKITIYTQGACGYCKTIKEELEKNNIEFEERLINEWSDEWQKVNSLTSIPTTPTICYEDSYFIPGRDFGSPQQLINIFKNFKKSEFSESKQVLERIKSLNYNINTAFGRLDQLLRTIEQKIDKL
tara:strand:+ start:144 stop:521 length:378 start_codon:yes stop_codon:yes gene_type:complete